MDLAKGALDLTNGQRYSLDGSEIPFPTLASIQALLPSYLQGDGAGAMRDALLTTIAKLANKIQADIAVNQNGIQSPRFADDGLLAVRGVLRRMPRYVGETTAQYRTRLLSAQVGITPNAIRNAVLAAAAPFGANVAFQEPASDAEFWTDDDPNQETWCSFFQPDNGIYWNYDPTVPNPTTGGYFAPDVYGSLFWIIMQLGAGADASAPFLNDDDSAIPPTNGTFGYTDPSDFFADDTNDYGFMSFDGDPLELQITAIAQAMKAFGVSWALFEDPFLNAAY